jgi:uncharacterized protein (UPF0264 family)
VQRGPEIPLVTALLASVQSPHEAILALSGGADIIDCKDPANGALGALPAALIKEIAAAVGGRRPVSATAGNPPMEPRALVAAVNAIAATGVDFVKIGLVTSRRCAACVRAVGRESAGGRLVAVLFADCNPDFGILNELPQAGFAGVMLDTANKCTGGLRTWMSPRGLGRFVEQARRAHLMVGLAGSLRLEDVPELLHLAADFMGFRGALCEGGARSSTISATRLAALRRAFDSTRVQYLPRVSC